MNRLHNAKEIEEDDDSGRVRRQISQCEFVAFLCIGIDLYSCTKRDVPTGNLDRKNGEEIIDLLKLSNRNLKQTILLITHDERIALGADRIVTIEDGQIVNDHFRRSAEWHTGIL